jgi:predicted unusual protein kinase regulating ubiquinone biosynthesis (AarF/ABC1/UbiB family)
VLFRFVFRSLYGLHAFNGDPHPGNYLFHRDGRVTFLDFGLGETLQRRRR